MAQKRKQDQTKLILSAALALADARGWESIEMADVARRAKLSVAGAEKHFPDIWAILTCVLKKLEDDTIKSVKPHLSDNVRDNLFEIMMTRFEFMQEHRRAYASIPKAFLSAPQQASKFGRQFFDTMKTMLETAHAPASPLHIAGMGALYLSLGHVWTEDKTPDMAKTMAALDRRLDRLEQVMGYIPCG